MNSSRSKSDLVELKHQALDYFSINSDIQKRVEEALNSLFYESPYDAFGYLVRNFSYFSIQINKKNISFLNNQVGILSNSFETSFYQSNMCFKAYNTRCQISTHVYY